ncbi:MAG: cytochrome B6 [Flavobacterium sp.]|nr:cytochrome B6 [Flavobacterium sp.]
MKNLIIFFIYFFCVFLISCSDDVLEYENVPDAKIAIGKLIFFDKNLSNPIGQACASCHAPEKGFSDSQNQAISVGANGSGFSNRNAPNLSYNIFAPTQFYNASDQTYIGGFFYDGRSPNLQEQMIHPFTASSEMNNGSIANVVDKIKNAVYFSEIQKIYGNQTSDSEIFSAVADAVAKYQTSREVNSFTSKFDYYSKQLVTFTEDEKQGLALFKGKAKCAQCHVIDADSNTGKVLFTDFSYDNLGIPRNNSNPFYNQPSNPAGNAYVDLGIGIVKNEPEHYGKFKVPSLRNSAISAPYYHNGSIATLKEAIHFYNVRDLNTGEFNAPEYNQNINVTELGNLGLTEKEEFQIEKFINTLTDHYRK